MPNFLLVGWSAAEATPTIVQMYMN